MTMRTRRRRFWTLAAVFAACMGWLHADAVLARSHRMAHAREIAAGLRTELAQTGATPMSGRCEGTPLSNDGAAPANQPDACWLNEIMQVFTTSGVSDLAWSLDESRASAVSGEARLTVSFIASYTVVFNSLERLGSARRPVRVAAITLKSDSPSRPGEITVTARLVVRPPHDTGVRR